MPKNRLSTAKKFAPNSKADEEMRSAVTAIKGILALQIMDKHKKKLISRMIWAITEAHGKYKTRFRSEAVLTTADCKMQHEHVYPRKELIEEIMKVPENCERILEKAVACVVTEQEHRLLNKVSKENPNVNGWDRYKKAGITVYGMLSGEKYIDSQKTER
jgi:hypothetical protein